MAGYALLQANVRVCGHGLRRPFMWSAAPNTACAASGAIHVLNFWRQPHAQTQTHTEDQAVVWMLTKWRWKSRQIRNGTEVLHVYKYTTQAESRTKVRTSRTTRQWTNPILSFSLLPLPFRFSYLLRPRLSQFLPHPPTPFLPLPFLSPCWNLGRGSGGNSSNSNHPTNKEATVS